MRIPYRVLTLMLAVVLVSGACSNLPRDPKLTLQQVKSRPMRVGLVENAPWVIRTEAEPRGAEVELVRELANQLGTTAEWHWGGEQQQMEALEHHQLDLVIGGITKKTPWADYVGLTGPYFEEAIGVGAPADTSIRDLKGAQVAVLDGDQIISLLEKKGAVPLRVDDLRKANGLAAGPLWRLQTLNLYDTGLRLDSLKHVMAVPAGENGFIKRIDEFLHQKRSDVPRMLQTNEI